MSTGPIESQIINTLSCSLNLSSLKIINESLMHNVPEGSETHFKIVVITNDFNNLSIIKRHKLIYKILDDFNGSIRMIGHSAGGHLASRMVCKKFLKNNESAREGSSRRVQVSRLAAGQTCTRPWSASGRCICHCKKR